VDVSPDPIYHIAEGADWRTAQRTGSYRAPSLDTEGFVHCSTATQLRRVARTFYSGRADLVLLSINPQRLTASLRYERAIDVADDYPHVYGPVNVDAVVSATPFDADGDVRVE
jgi:uncharacterized protein (DUF952 family)